MSPLVATFAAVGVGVVLATYYFPPTVATKAPKVWLMFVALFAVPSGLLTGLCALLADAPLVWAAACLVGLVPGVWMAKNALWGAQLQTGLNAMVAAGNVDDEGLDKLRSLVAEHNRNDADGMGMGLMQIANVAAQLGRFDIAVDVMSSMPEEIDDDLRLWRGADLAWACFYSGLFEDARRFLADVEDLAAQGLQHALGGNTSHRHHILSAVLPAYDGRAKAALKALEDIETLESLDVLVTRAARAHAYAAVGKRKKAYAELVEARELLGDEAIARAQIPEGPATALAQELASDSAYR